MSGRYRTVQGDTWDGIAYQQLGSTDETDRLMRANLEHLGTLIFPAGTELILPDRETQSGDMLPPWKR